MCSPFLPFVPQLLPVLLLAPELSDDVEVQVSSRRALQAAAEVCGSTARTGLSPA